MASETFDSMPPGAPVTFDNDGWPDIEITNDGVVLKQGDQTVTLPGRGILKGSTTVHPGNRMDVNKVSITLFAGRVDVAANRDDVRVIRESFVRGERYEQQAGTETETE